MNSPVTIGAKKREIIHTCHGRSFGEGTFVMNLKHTRAAFQGIGCCAGTATFAQQIPELPFDSLQFEFAQLRSPFPPVMLQQFQFPL